MKITFKVTKKQIDEAYDKVLEQARAKTNIKGFRKGQAPKEMVVKEVGQSKLQQMALEQALPEAYSKEVRKQKLNPISYPEISLKKGKMGEDFEFEADVPEMPEVKLGDYQKEIKNVSASANIWTPDKGEAKDAKTPDQQDKVDLILRKLLETVKLEVPQILVDREVNRQMSQLLQQIEKLGMKVDDYLKSSQQTKESLNQQYTQRSRDQLALEFILMKIAEDQKIKVSQKELDEFVDQVEDPQVKERLKQSPEQQYSIQVTLTKQKVMDALLKLA